MAKATDGLERVLSRSVSWALPALTVVGGVGAGLTIGVASGVLVVVTGTLLGAILLMWFSLRTLAGDAPVDARLELAGRVHAPSELAERKRRALRALKDIEQEHAIGKIDEKDYATLQADYRAQAKALMSEMDSDLAPLRAEAEAVAAAHLKKRGLEEAAKPEKPAESSDDSEPENASETVVCAKCETVNDPDATFCKKCGAKIGAEESE